MEFLTKLVDCPPENQQIRPLVNHEGRGESIQDCIYFIVSCWRVTIWKPFLSMTNLKKVCQVHLA